jgi:hypothetical protein
MAVLLDFGFFVNINENATTGEALDGDIVSIAVDHALDLVANVFDQFPVQRIGDDEMSHCILLE